MAALKRREQLNGIVNRIKLVGIELEGGWDRNVPGEEVIRDGSVEFHPPQFPPTPRDPVTGNRRPLQPDQQALIDNWRQPRAAIGEIVSKPLPVGQVAAWVRKCYPEHVNKTCGLHVHMSFEHKLNYSRLMTPDFTPYMVNAIREFGHKESLPDDHALWPRVNEPNHPHCAHIYLGDKQAIVGVKDYRSRGKEYSRYTFLNYCEKFHKTIECRGLCMFTDAEQAVRAIMCVLDSTNAFLSKIRRVERATSVSVSAKPMVYEEFGTIVR